MLLCSDKNGTTCPHLANDKDVGEPGGEAVACAILDMHHVKRAGVTLPVGDHANTPQVSTACHHAQVSWEEKKWESMSLQDSHTQIVLLHLERTCI